MPFEPFQNFLQRAAARKGISNEFYAARICSDFRQILPEILEGKENVEQFVQPAHFKNAELVISVSSSGWAQEITMRKHRIIKKINEIEGKEVLKKLRTRISN
jgi:hypothetical protein